ncbi:hypothetical protein GCM10010274_57920 [Streptomyces lavendofoliae]|uniref:Uncharacterized protein n=1 Tax=Streptomyces lavendofoliae TaxID=67314 RepID=A0A918I334_9ACTN|nr:hypothetical protein GCM10010274_57920 [Streptomyces lavendofoliae]
MADGTDPAEGVSTALRALLNAEKALRAAHHALGKEPIPARVFAWSRRVHGEQGRRRRSTSGPFPHARGAVFLTSESGKCARSNCLAALTPASNSGQVPGQGKRRRRQEDARQRVAARTAPDAGQWEVVVETRDQAEMRTRLRRLREAGVDGSMIRIDTLCGRLGLPTTYRLSRFMTDPAREPEPEHSDH